MSAFDPGALDSLVGVVFPTGSLLGYERGVDGNTVDALTGDVTLSDTFYQLYTGYVSNINFSGGGEIVSVDTTYHAANVGHADTYFATFGSLTIRDGGVDTIYYIHGVSENGLFLSTTQDLTELHVNSNSIDKLFTFSNDANPTFPLNFNYDASAYVAPVCFVEGARILTARGEVAVEDLVEGDEVVTATGGLRPAIWIGSRNVRCDRHPRPDEAHPVRVRASAFGDGLPVRDLRLSPGHAVAIDDVLVPVGLLTNGATIAQERAQAVRYFHVELDAHDVILAEGLACESYLDDGNRQVFGNAPGHLALYGRLDPQDWDQACLPVLRQSPESEALRERLLARAQDLGWTLTHTSQVTLEADGQAVAPVLSTEQRLWFLAPAARELVLRSPASVPALTMPGHPDPRLLGVALASLRIDGEAVDLTSDTLDHGFHPPEHQEAGDVRRSWRWTDGAAELPPTSTSTMIELEVSMVSPRWVAPDQTLNQASPLAPRLRLVEAG